jgi:hypothetical protein
MSDPVTIPCQWLALCVRDADGVVEHPVLGEVPTCTVCAASHDLTLVPATFVRVGPAVVEAVPS